MRFIPAYQANILMNRVRDAVRDRKWPRSYIDIFDHLMFRQRRHGQDRVQVSYTTITDNLHIGRSALVEAIRDFDAAGLLRKLRTRVPVMVKGRRMGTVQGTNIYLFCFPEPEFRGETTIEKNIKKPAQEQGIAAAARPAGPVSPELWAALCGLGARVREAPV